MGKITNTFKGEFAEKLIAQLGGVNQVSRECHIRTSSVCSWYKSGVPRARLDYLKLAHPELPVWAEAPDWNKEPSTLSK